MAFRYVLGLRDLPQIIVSTSDFQAAILEAKRSEVLGSIVAQSAKLLPAQSLHPRPAMQTTYAAPTNELEKKMVEVWGRVLGIAEVGIHDNYFDLGGDSVQAIQIIAQTNQEGFQLAPQQLFQRQTVAELVAVAATSMPAVQERAEMSRSTSSPSEFPLAGLDEKGLQELAEFLEETARSRQ